MPVKKRIKKNVTLTYLGDIINSHMSYNILLTEKIGFLVATSALILTIGLTQIISQGFTYYSSFTKLAMIVVSIGAAFTVIICISAEKPEFIKKVRTFHPLSLTEFNDESTRKYNNDLKLILMSDEKIIENYSAQTLHLKEEIFKKTQKVTFATYMIVGSVIFSAILVSIHMYIDILGG